MEIPAPFPRMTYREAMTVRHDKPDTLRPELVDLNENFPREQLQGVPRRVEGGGVIKAINAKGSPAPSARAEELRD